MGPITGAEEKIFNNLLILDSVRGTDSTGVAVIPRNGEVRVTKQIGDPFQLMDTKAYTRAFTGLHRSLIGHNRFATVGGVSRKTAHPFEFDTLVGVHNGTLNTKYRLEDANQFQVDSENLYHHIDKKGLTDALHYLGGAWALVWWDKVAETMNFLRNKERPLYYTVTSDGKHVYWASEDWMLTSALGRANIKHCTPVMFDEDLHYSFAIDSLGNIAKPRVTPAASKYVAPVYSGYVHISHKPVVKAVTVEEEEQSVKKTRVAPVTALSKSSKSGYSGTKDVRLELLDLSTDSHGGKFFICFDESYPSATIRFYYGREITAPKSLLGESIIADIGNLNMTDGYYKVIASSVKWEDSPFDADDDPAMDDDEVYEGHNGLMYNLNDWIGKYGDCVWCSGSVLPTETHQLTTEGHAVCHNCCDNDEVKQYVKIAKSYSIQ
jgi:hypothetical protein